MPFWARFGVYAKLGFARTNVRTARGRTQMENYFSVHGDLQTQAQTHLEVFSTHGTYSGR